VNVAENAKWRTGVNRRVWQAPTLPLVSVIIDNYNYGRFLRAAVESVFQQTYPAIECIIIDDASTDDSRAVIQDILSEHPDVTALFRPENSGQSLSCQDAFKASSGQYVIFLDADDILLPSAVETHIYVHLSLRIPVGFSSGDMLQVVNNEIVLGTRQTFSSYVVSGKGVKPAQIRLIDKSLGELYPLRPLPGIENKLHFVEPGSAYWVWSPMSGNCYRRDALQLVFDNPALLALKQSSDAYLNLGISVLTGSVLIDQPLAVYRHHGANGLASHPQLNGFLSLKLIHGSDNAQLSRLLLIDHFMACAGELIERSSPSHFVKAIQELGKHASFHGADYYLSRLVAKNWKMLRAYFSPCELLMWSIALIRKKF
jgi:glycosyltransferase involved in cell wall biosynthesis